MTNPEHPDPPKPSDRPDVQDVFSALQHSADGEFEGAGDER